MITQPSDTNVDKTQQQTQASKVVTSDDLANTLNGQEGRFVAVLPGGDTLIADARRGHSITGLRVIPKPQGDSFNVAKIAEFRSESPDGARVQEQPAGRDRTASGADALQVIPVAV